MSKELISRLVGALIFLFIWLLFVYFFDRLWCNALILGLLSIAWVEWCRLVGVSQRWQIEWLRLLFVVCGLISYFAFDQLAQLNYNWYFISIWSSAALLSLLWLALSILMVYLIRFDVTIDQFHLRGKYFFIRVILLLFGAGLLLPCLWFFDFIYQQERIGRLLLTYLIGICIVSDVMAYFGGKTLGRHRLCVRISPNKTIEGSAIGVLAAATWVALGWYNFLQPVLPPLFALSMLSVAVVAVVGDLFESLVKRLAGVKDSGTIVYGHGGMYDRIDSVTAACPVFVFGLCFFL